MPRSSSTLFPLFVLASLGTGCSQDRELIPDDFADASIVRDDVKLRHNIAYFVLKRLRQYQSASKILTGDFPAEDKEFQYGCSESARAISVLVPTEDLKDEGFDEYLPILLKTTFRGRLRYQMDVDAAGAQATSSCKGKFGHVEWSALSDLIRLKTAFTETYRFTETRTAARKDGGPESLSRRSVDKDWRTSCEVLTASGTGRGGVLGMTCEESGGVASRVSGDYPASRAVNLDLQPAREISISVELKERGGKAEISSTRLISGRYENILNARGDTLSLSFRGVTYSEDDCTPTAGQVDIVAQEAGGKRRDLIADFDGGRRMLSEAGREATEFLEASGAESEVSCTSLM